MHQFVSLPFVFSCIVVILFKYWNLAIIPVVRFDEWFPIKWKVDEWTGEELYGWRKNKSKISGCQFKTWFVHWVATYLIVQQLRALVCQGKQSFFPWQPLSAAFSRLHFREKKKFASYVLSYSLTSHDFALISVKTGTLLVLWWQLSEELILRKFPNCCSIHA